MGAESKGYNLLTTLRYIEERRPGSMPEVMARLSPELQELLPVAERFTFYPRAYWSELIRAFVALYDDPNERADVVIGLGERVCEAQTNQFLRLVMRIMTPQLLGSKIDAIWKRDHRGGGFRTDGSKLDQNIVTYEVYDVELAYFNAIARGFVQFAFRSMGCKDIDVKTKEDLLVEWPSTVELTVTWN